MPPAMPVVGDCRVICGRLVVTTAHHSCQNAMTAKVRPDEVPQALDQNNQEVVYVVDAVGQTTHVLMPIGDARRMFDEYLRRELKVGIDEAARGESTEWKADEFLERAHGQHNKRVG